MHEATRMIRPHVHCSQESLKQKLYVATSDTGLTHTKHSTIFDTAGDDEHAARTICVRMVHHSTLLPHFSDFSCLLAYMKCTTARWYCGRFEIDIKVCPPSREPSGRYHSSNVSLFERGCLVDVSAAPTPSGGATCASSSS